VARLMAGEKGLNFGGGFEIITKFSTLFPKQKKKKLPLL
jgi:hypothetical protein